MLASDVKHKHPDMRGPYKTARKAPVFVPPWYYITVFGKHVTFVCFC